MDISEYQQRAGETDILPGDDDIMPLLGLAGEVGQLIAEYKRQRDKVGYRAFRDEVHEELGDILWYAAALARYNGFDLNEIGQGVDDLEVDLVIEETVAAIRQLPIPVIAAIEGACVGAALEIAVACDVRIAATGAHFSLPATHLGLLYRPEGVAGLVESLGRETVTRLLIFGARIPAEEAPATALASVVVERGAALESAVGLARSVSSATPEAVAATKRLIGEIGADRADLSHWEDCRRALLASEARSHALSKVRERVGSDKRPPGSTRRNETP